MILDSRISHRGDGEATTSSSVWLYLSRDISSLATKKPMWPTLMRVGATRE